MPRDAFRRSLRDAILAERPVAYWPLDDASGSTATDLSGNGHHGTYTGTVVPNAPAPRGPRATNFAATGYVGLPASSPLDITGALTLELWVNLNATPGTYWMMSNGPAIP